MSIAQVQGEVTIRDLSKSFTLNGQRLNVLRDLNFGIAAGEILAIVGPSGCGKTTLLRVMAGLEQPDRGEVRIDGAPVTGVGTERAVIFQEPRLLPWLSVLANVTFGLEVRGLPKSEAEQRAPLYPAGRAAGLRNRLSTSIVWRHGAAGRDRPRPDRPAGNPVA